MSPAPRSTNVAKLDRRSRRRFPIFLPLRYIVSGVEGEGWTLNISSNGAMIHVPQKLPTGRGIRLFIYWPAKLDDRIPLQLVVKGTIRRSTAMTTAIAICTYEFRLQSSLAAFPELLSASMRSQRLNVI
jgi:hypothetical protein